MRHALLALIAAAIATPAVAGDFVAGGEHYSYTAARDAHGDVVLNGQAGHDPFALRVHGNHVSGSMGYSAISFKVSDEALARLNDEVPGAARQASAAPATLAAN
ncbi:hypothetical protein HZF05_08435 [Sphingomonas sp. CGMCC 1.13654]|uniref:Uncharacterized protein n=1 Tax=Sphingomonas chungangi TaxID=2683589 RepID=A0A838L523_9SPHN|nr:hypothetical protein [Sphingomonas chungangi]MBA2934127.1 hypothetical protein [Sphingomonas chungangi]MVW57168.1 hypothetical protein [Sphingomonas chungangi]